MFKSRSIISELTITYILLHSSQTAADKSEKLLFALAVGANSIYFHFYINMESSLHKHILSERTYLLQASPKSICDHPLTSDKLL